VARPSEVTVTAALGPARLDDDVAVVSRRFTAKLTWPDRHRAELDVAVEGRRARVTAVRIEEASERGVTGLTLDGVPVQQLLEDVLATLTMVVTGPGTLEPVGTEAEATRAAGAVRRAVGRRGSSERLAEVAEAYAAGGVEAVVERVGVTSRHAYRLVAQAEEAGLIERRKR
jgi:hypothetical protein